MNACRLVLYGLIISHILLFSLPAISAPATLLFADDFNRGFPGWTAIEPKLPAGVSYANGPMLWQYDLVRKAFVEKSNLNSSVGLGPLLVNQTESGGSFTFTARMVPDDDDGFGLVFGYQNPSNYFRATFARQNRTTYPFTGWSVEEIKNGVMSILYGAGSPNPGPNWVNTRYRPFDVILKIDQETKLDLTVIDDSEKVFIPMVQGPITNALLQGVTLPRPATGKVGLFSWGMDTPVDSAANPVCFRISNLSLAPNPLTGDLATIANGWVPHTIRKLGETNENLGINGGLGLWSIGVNSAGPLGRLFDNINCHQYGTSDTFAGNTRTDFTGPAISAGDMNWTNVILRTRIESFDDDGFGVLFRFQDTNNFYRLTFRYQAQNQVGAAPVGVSIQKRVAGLWQEAFHDPNTYLPPIKGEPFDLLLFLNGQEVSFSIFQPNDKKGISFGPIRIPGLVIQGNETPVVLDHGQIGLHTWATGLTRYDHVEVFSGNGVPLEIRASPFGPPTPAPGVYTYASGGSVTASVASPQILKPGERQISRGWRGAGSVPTQGSSPTITFNITQPTIIDWQWQLQYLLTLTKTDGGDLFLTEDSWVDAGKTVTLSAQAKPGFVFDHWEGQSGSTEPVLVFSVDKPMTYHAVFRVDTDGDGMADDWENQYFSNLQSNADADPDGDGLSNIQEFRLGTPPRARGRLITRPEISSRWENPQRDPLLPGELFIHDFGGGYRGLWENSGDGRGATDGTFIGPTQVSQVSFQGPLMVVRPSAWESQWADYDISTFMAVGDADAASLYFRYQDENNWYRVTLNGRTTEYPDDPPFGISVQKKVDGFYSEIGRNQSLGTDPNDTDAFKQVALYVSLSGPNIQIRAVGLDTSLNPPQYNPDTTATLEIVDESFTTGRIGLGTYNMGNEQSAPSPTIPIEMGLFVGGLIVSQEGTALFEESWASLPQHESLPVDWENPWTQAQEPKGDWRVTAHASLVQLGNPGQNPPAGSTVLPISGDGPMLVGPTISENDFQFSTMAAPYDDDGFGLVFDYQDNENYRRALLFSQRLTGGRTVQGFTVSEKKNGAWTDLFAADPSFVYVPGQPIQLTLVRRGNEYRFGVLTQESPARLFSWVWKAEPVTNARLGVACWAQTDQHFYDVEIRSLTNESLPEFRILSLERQAGSVILTIKNPLGLPLSIESSKSLLPGSWGTIATGITSTTWTGPADGPAQFFRLKSE